MAAARRALLLAAAAAALGAAFLILASAGLPQRATYTGIVSPGQTPIAPEVNALAPLFQRPTLDGRVISLADMRGQPVIINFWATWCAPCRVEMSSLQAIYDEYAAQGLRILAVNLGESPALIRDWQHSLGLTYDILLDEQQTVAALYYLRGQPSTYVLSPAGVITHIFYGPVSETVLRSAVAEYLN
jgi:peroxiredoxin